jgi:hypothetical protein
VLDVPDRPEPEDQGFLLRQEGKVYQVRDQAMLQRWIVERRIWRTDEISEDGSVWVKAEEMDECAVFFTLVDQADQAGGTSSSTGKGLFARPDAMGDPLSSVSMSTPDPDEMGSPPTQKVTSVEAHEEVESSKEPDEDMSIVEIEASTPLRLAVEAIPGEEPASLEIPGSPLSPDEPTMDMALGEEDFFSEEQSVDYANGSSVAASDDFEEELEWMQTRRKNMVTWWLLFFGALGGAGYFALDFLNQNDVPGEKIPTSEAADIVPEEPVVQAVAAAATEGDSGSAEAAEGGQDVAEEPPVEDVMAEVEPAAPTAPPAAAPPQTRTEPVPSASPAAAPARLNPSREVDRGWSRIDREDWSGARTHFNNALTADPGNGDAKFGLAYVNEKQDRLEEAVRQYCRLQATGSGESKAEAAGRLRALARECP